MTYLSFWQMLAISSFGFAVLGFVFYGCIPSRWPDPKKWKKVIIFCSIFLGLSVVFCFAESILFVAKKTDQIERNTAFLIIPWIMYLAIVLRKKIFTDDSYEYYHRQAMSEFGFDEYGNNSSDKQKEQL